MKVPFPGKVRVTLRDVADELVSEGYLLYQVNDRDFFITLKTNNQLNGVPVYLGTDKIEYAL